MKLIELNLFEFQTMVLKLFKEITYQEDIMFRTKDLNYIILDNEFHFATTSQDNKQEIQLLNHIEDYLSSHTLDLNYRIEWLIADYSNAKYKEIEKRYPNIKIINKNSIYDYLKT